MKYNHKFNKDQVAYTNDGTVDEHCAICNFYIRSGKCAIVIGEIIPKGWCNKFEKS